MSGELNLHSGGELVTREVLKTIVAPPPTDTWKPIAHYDLVNAIDRQLAVRDIKVVKEEYALAHDGLRLFGVLELVVPGTNGGSGKDYHFAMGVRTANDRSFATQLAIGARIFVCSNLAFSGDLIAMNRKHTAHFDLNADISRAVDKFQAHVGSFGRKFDALKERQLTLSEAKALLFDALAQDVIPARVFPTVLEGFKAHDGTWSAWDAHNLCTAAFRQLAPAAKFSATAQLGQLFQLTA